MKKTITILMALMMLCFTQCKQMPEGGDENSRKVKVSCTIPINNGDRSDFTNLMETGKVNWSEGYERVYLAVHGATPQIIELVSWAEGTPSNLEFTGEAAEGLIMSGEEYDIWYFGHSQQLETPYYNLSDDGSVLTGSIAAQSGRLEDLGYCHIATTKVTAVTENDKVKLNLKGTLANQIAIALLDLNNVTELYGDAIVGTEYTLSYDGERYELDVTADNNAKIEVESASGISYVALLPNDKNESMIKHKKGDKTYAYTFHGEIKANKIYYRSGLDGTTPEALKWEEIEEPETPTINGHEYVDLGLPSGLLWATCNVGANAPEEYGNYYAWGETSTKATYTEENCATYGLSNSQLQSQGYIDGEGNLTAQHDAAAANWGGDWRMPTRAEQEELLNNCTWTWTTQNGVNGYKVTSKVNSNYIFLPAAGYRNGSSLYDAGSFGYYRSSTLYESSSYGAYGLGFGSDFRYMYSFYRNSGRSVRPVSGGNNAEPEEPETPETPDNNNHEYVDLGLSVKWATCNVGANAPEAYGNYYAWGETSTKSNYSSSNCPTYLLDNSQLQSQGYIDSEGNLTAQYDAAAANWGGDWRMPTKAEMQELINNCTWTWTTQNGVNGYKVTSKVNSNYIFLPAAGCRNGSSLLYAGSRGGFWSSKPYGSNSVSAYYLDFTSSSLYMYYDYRYLGQSVRPVCGGNNAEPEEPETPANQTFTVNGVTFTMIAVEGGTFSMGATSEQGSSAYSDESPVHSVTLSDYCIGETEVTQELWEAVMGSNPCDFIGYPQRPVENVTWNDCQEFITKLNELTGENFRLPTEAEWEYAARGGNKSQGYKYSGSNTIGNVAWYYDNSSSETHDVKTKQANELGIYDMSGNVSEWCHDWEGNYSSGSQTNPTGPTSGYFRVCRGGSWRNSAMDCRVSSRGSRDPGSSCDYSGIRLILQ